VLTARYFPAAVMDQATFRYSSQLQTWSGLRPGFRQVRAGLRHAFDFFVENLVANLLYQSRHVEVDAAGSCACRHMECRTRSSAVAERPRDASCLSVVSFNIPTAQFFITSYCGFRFTSAQHSIKFCSAIYYCLRRCPTKTPQTNAPRS